MSDDTTPPTSPATEPTAPAPDSFAVKLKAARTASGTTQKKVGELASVSVATIKNWETGKFKPSPQKQAAVLRRLREAQVRTELPPESYDAQTLAETLITHPANQPGSLLPSTAATPEELAHDPHEPITDAEAEKLLAEYDKKPLSPEDDAALKAAEPEFFRKLDEITKEPAPLPDIPIGNVHTSQDGVVRRRLADDDDRVGMELIDGRRWFTVGFVPPHPRAKPAVKATLPPAAPQEPIPAPPAHPEPRVHIFDTPKAPEPVGSAAEPTVAAPGRRDWSWWNS